MSPKHRAQFRQAEELAFQDVPLRVADHNPFVTLYPPPRIEAIQLLIMAKEVVGVAIDVPNPLNLNDADNRNFFRHFIAMFNPALCDCVGVRHLLNHKCTDKSLLLNVKNADNQTYHH